jgi:RNA polymerase sigma-70 factor (ECF subfamily)
LLFLFSIEAKLKLNPSSNYVHVKNNYSMFNSEYEDDLIRGCLCNNSKSQELLYKHFFGYSMSLCMRYLANRSDALDVMNEAFLKIFSKIQNYDNQKSFKAWIRRILVNCCIDFIRRQKRVILVFNDSSYNDTSDTGDLPVQKLSAEEILALLSQLPDRYRITFNLYEIEGFSHDEIAVMLNIPASTSRSNLTRAKKKLRELIEKKYSYAKF